MFVLERTCFWDSLVLPVLPQVVLPGDAEGERGGRMRQVGVVDALWYLLFAVTGEPVIWIAPHKILSTKASWYQCNVWSYQRTMGVGDPSSDVHESFSVWPSRIVSFCGSPVISGELGGSEIEMHFISNQTRSHLWEAPEARKILVHNESDKSDRPLQPPSLIRSAVLFFEPKWPNNIQQRPQLR